MPKKKRKKTLSPEQIQKMQEGRAKAQANRVRVENTKKQVEMLSDMEKRIRDSSRGGSKPIRIPSRRRRHF